MFEYKNDNIYLAKFMIFKYNYIYLIDEFGIFLNNINIFNFHCFNNNL